jgi:tetratricopeptide (TPR) repeat protein
MSLLDEAADVYERALAIDDDNIGALIDLAHLRRREGAFQGAVRMAERAIELIDKRNSS